MNNVLPFPSNNSYVKEFISVLNENKRDTYDFITLLKGISDLEVMLKQSNENIALMQKQIDELKEIKKHPIKAQLNETTQVMQDNTTHFKKQLLGLKSNVINGCKKSLEAIKLGGISALDKVFSFFKISQGLEVIAKLMANNNEKCRQEINKIELFSNEYHKSGRALKNMGRMIMGKKPIDEVKENRKLCNALTKPYRMEKTLSAKIEQKVYVMAKNWEDFHTFLKINNIIKENNKLKDSKKLNENEKPIAQTQSDIDIVSKVKKYNDEKAIATQKKVSQVNITSNKSKENNKRATER